MSRTTETRRQSSRPKAKPDASAWGVRSAPIDLTVAYGDVLEVDSKSDVRTGMRLIDRLVDIFLSVAVAAESTVDVERRTGELGVDSDVILDDVVRLFECLVERRAVHVRIEPSSVGVRIIERGTIPAPAGVERGQFLDASTERLKRRIAVVVVCLDIAGADVEVRIRSDLVLDSAI